MTTTPDRRPWPAFLHSDCVVVPACVAAFLVVHSDLARLRTRARGDDPVVDAVLVALTISGNTRRTQTSAPSANTGSEMDADSQVGQPQSMTTGEAAEQLGVTTRAVRFAIAEGRLSAARTPHGWVIRPAEVDHLRRRRAAERK